MFTRRTLVSAALVFLIAAAPMAGSAKGTFTANGKTFDLKYAYATTIKNPFDKKKTDVFVVVTDKDIPPGSLFDEFELMSLADKGITGFTVETIRKSVAKDLQKDTEDPDFASSAASPGSPSASSRRCCRMRSPSGMPDTPSPKHCSAPGRRHRREEACPSMRPVSRAFQKMTQFSSVGKQKVALTAMTKDRVLCATFDVPVQAKTSGAAASMETRRH